MSEHTSYGGQAVIEGVMIRGRTRYAVAVRLPSGEITVDRGEVDSIARNVPFLRWPFLRGTPALVDSLRLGYRTLLWAADQVSVGQGGPKPTPFQYTLTIVTALAFGIGIFVVLPAFATRWLPFLAHARSYGTILEQLTPSWNRVLPNLTEGLAKLLILVAYIALIGRSKEIKRVFMYHGAEHRVVNAWEAGEELTPDSTSGHSRIHQRCGTSFLFLFFFVGVLLHALFGWPGNPLILLGSRLLMIPIVAGVAYEIIRLAGRLAHCPTNPFLRGLMFALSWPGMALQQLTTAEPTPDQVEVALAAMAAVRADEEALSPAASPAEIPTADAPVAPPDPIS